MAPLVYNGIFQKNNTELFRAEMIAGYTMPITAVLMGKDGYAVERNTRFSDHVGGNVEVIKYLFEDRRTLNGWQIRNVLLARDSFVTVIAIDV